MLNLVTRHKFNKWLSLVPGMRYFGIPLKANSCQASTAITLSSSVREPANALRLCRKFFLDECARDLAKRPITSQQWMQWQRIFERDYAGASGKFRALLNFHLGSKNLGTYTGFKRPSPEEIKAAHEQIKKLSIDDDDEMVLSDVGINSIRKREFLYYLHSLDPKKFPKPLSLKYNIH